MSISTITLPLNPPPLKSQAKELDFYYGDFQALKGVSMPVYENRVTFQKPNPFPKSIFENVAYGLRVRNEKSRSYVEDKVEAALKSAALWDEVRDRLQEGGSNLSGGQQQRLCIARSLATDPEVILFDEPTSSLDPIATGAIEELIGEIKKTVSVLIVTHNMQQAARVSDYVAYMYLGELIEYGETQNIFMKPKRKETEDYITGRFG